MEPFKIEFSFKEHLGHHWNSQLMHKTIRVAEEGKLYLNQCALFMEKKEIPMQLSNIEFYKDGSVEQADVWFRTEMPAHGELNFELIAVKNTKTSVTDLYTRQKNNYVEIGNQVTAIRFPAKVESPLSGPVMGIRLANGKWTGSSELSKQESLIFSELPGLIQDVPNELAQSFQSYEVKSLESGPIFHRLKIRYNFANSGFYEMILTLRSEDPVIYFDEKYKHAGALKINFDGYKPKKAWYKTSQNYKGDAIHLEYENTQKQFAMQVGWDAYLKGVGSAYIFGNEKQKQCLGIISTNPDWFPFPYNQALHLSTSKDGLGIKASLQNGQRHWGIYVGEEKQFKNLVNDFYLWWWQNLCFNMDKVLNWNLVWSEMDQLEFPHTFFSKEELPKIRKQLQGNSVIQKFANKSKYKNPKTFTDAAVSLFYSGDQRIFSFLKNEMKFIDELSKKFLNQASFFDDHSLNNMVLSDELMKIYIGLELLLGSHLISTEEKRKVLIQLAFLQYALYEWSYMPQTFPFSPTSKKLYPGYVCGTPNQKTCYLTARGIGAAMLKNHPEFKNWAQRAIDDFDLLVSGTVAESGAYVDSPFYSCRETLRFGPFWIAMNRCGATKYNSKSKRWIKRMKKCYQYLSHMLTIPDPRLNNKRAYHPLGRSASGVIDPTIMISGMPFGEGDDTFLRQQRWCWEAQGKPNLDINDASGGRDMSMSMLSFLPIANVKPSEEPPLKSIRFQGMGLIGRSQVGTDYESNMLFRQDPFSWFLYEGNNGAVYLWGKGAPLSIRFGGYWNHTPNLMSIPFGNRLVFNQGKSAEWTDGIGNITNYSIMNKLADYGLSVTHDKDWHRELLFIKDINKEDPMFLLVRDDTFRKESSSAVHWWVMSKDVQPNGYESVGVIPPSGFTDQEWIKNMGKNWKDAPALKGQYHKFQTHFDVDLELFIAHPTNPTIVTDAVGFRPNRGRCVNTKLREYQQLIRIEQGEGKHYLTLLSPSWKDERPRVYKNIAGGYGVMVDTATQKNRLFLAPKKISYRDSSVEFNAKAGFSRIDSEGLLRLMVVNGRVESRGFKLSISKGKAGLFFDGRKIKIYTNEGSTAEYVIPRSKKIIPIETISI